MSSHGKVGGAPPGYAPQRRASGSFVTATELFIPATAALLALDQLLFVQPDLYLGTGAWPSRVLLQGVLLAAAILGGTIREIRRPSVPWMFASLGVAASGPAQFWAFEHGTNAFYAAQVPALLTAFAIGSGIRQLPRTWRAQLEADRVTRVLLQPFLGATLLFGFCALAIVSNAIGPIRASLAIAGGLAVAGLLTSIAVPTQRPAASIWRLRAVRGVGYSTLVALAVAAYGAERWLPLHRVITSSHPLVFHASSERCNLTITSGQGAYHLFVDDELRFSTFDESRWAQAMVLPALARVAQPRRVLVLSTGEGLIERELLKDPSVESITSVVRCRLPAELARRSAWLNKLTLNSMNSPKVSLFERDPAAYVVSASDARFDVAIVDLPDPAGPIPSKYYSRYFYQRLAARLSPGAVMVVQATSARRSPRTFATIGATLEAAGFQVQPAMVPLISRGEWSLYLATPGPLPAMLRPSVVAGSLAETTRGQFFHAWPDTLPPPDFVAKPSTLHDATVLDWFEREADAASPTAFPATQQLEPLPSRPRDRG